MHVLLSEHSDLFDFDIVLDVKRSPEINPTPWVQLLRVIHEFNAKRFFVQPFLSFHLLGRTDSRVDDGVFLRVYAFLCCGSPTISGDTTNMCQLGF